MTQIEFERHIEEVEALSEHLRESNAKLSAALAAAERMAMRATRLQEVTAALSQARTEREVADVLLGRGLGVVEGERGVLARVDGDHFEVIRMSGYPVDEAPLCPRSLDDPSPITFAVKSGEPVWLQSKDEHSRRFPGFFKCVGLLSPSSATVAVPLRHCGEIVGALGMSFAKATALGVADRAFTLLLAQAAADALFRARSYDAEQVARREAETRAKAGVDVLGIVAHDLRNPLNVIGASGDLLADVEGLPPAERHKMLDIMRRAVRQMNRLIGDLLDATRVQAGRLTLELSSVDARDIVRSAEEMCRHDAESRHITLQIVSPAYECRVRADEGRLLQAVGNLLGNALKFTRPGGCVVLSLSVDNEEVVISVADTGPGLTPDQQTHLFDAFWQARDGDRRGVGLGLTITKGIVEAHGGRIWVDSTPGAGSTFSFALPVRRDK